ncbi:MAG TPA: hypothetical protein VFC19_28290 [Candidatus Limnocylindrales bacterium]|nr:hypothetical protein [Candidatus Limnocylindrales bacterium]
MTRHEPPDPLRLYTITVAYRLTQRRIPSQIIKQWASRYGRLVKREFIAINGYEPPKVRRLIQGVPRPVYAYRERDIPMLDQVWDNLVRRMGITYPVG